MRSEVQKYPGWDARIVVAIAQAENATCDPTRHNLTASETHRDRDGNVICVGSYGVLQVGCLHYASGEDRDDLATNVRIAYRVYNERAKWDVSGYNAWSTYTSGKYKAHL